MPFERRDPRRGLLRDLKKTPSRLPREFAVITIRRYALLGVPIMTNSPAEQRFFRRKEAAEYLQNTYRIPCTAKTLANYASSEKGPAFHYAGRHAIYSRAELDKWARLLLGLFPTGPKKRRAESEIL